MTVATRRNNDNGLGTRGRRNARLLSKIFVCGLLLTTYFLVDANAHHGELPNSIPEAAPYNTEEAKTHPPPFDAYVAASGNPAVCAACHKKIYDQWNGSMMANAWRDPAWRAAFLMVTRLTATDGNCDIPDPPDGTTKASINPFANEDCSSTFDLGDESHTTTGSGSLLDDFCSRCHMPDNYIDQVSLENVTRDEESGQERGLVDPDFDPTSDRNTGTAFAKVAGKSINTVAGQLGIACTFCHTIGETRDTPYHNYEKAGAQHDTVPGAGSPGESAAKKQQQVFDPPAVTEPNLGYSIGSGSFRVSPQAIVAPQRFGPLAHGDDHPEDNAYVGETFQTDVPYERGSFELSIHQGKYDVLYERSEMCGTCHDVTNPLTIKNQLGYWVGGFAIERTYTEWQNSRYADRQGNENFDPRFKRDCQTCHMQQTYGQPGTAQTLYEGGMAVAPLTSEVATGAGDRKTFYSHNFTGGNTYSTRLVGKTMDLGKPVPWPELSVFSFSSADPSSPYRNAYWNVAGSAPPTQHARLAWDRLRNTLDLELTAPRSVPSGTEPVIRVTVANTGAGHKFPTGFPEGRIAWVAVRAVDLATQQELEISDSYWHRTSLGVGYLTDRDMLDPAFGECNWAVPAGSPDPFARHFRAVASLGDGCPTLALPYATPLNLVTNDYGMPIDVDGRVIDRSNPLGLPQFEDFDGDGDIFDDAFLIDDRLRPQPHPGANVTLDRYSVVIPSGTVGPVAITAAVYYQSMEAVVAKLFMGNLADTDLDTVLEPCVLKAACDGRVPRGEPAVVEGAPPVPMEVTNWIINIDGETDVTPPTISLYPGSGHANADVVVKLSASEPLTGINASTFSLKTSNGLPVPAAVDQIDDFTWGLFPDQVFLKPGESYNAQVAGQVCDFNENCREVDVTVTFTITDPMHGGSLAALPRATPR